MRTLWSDLRYGVRMLAKKPGFTLVAIITLALGIGATTAIFSVVNSVLLRPLPYRNPDQLVVLSATNPAGSLDRGTISYPEAQDFREQNKVLETLSVFQSQSVNLTGGDQPDRVRGGFVSSDFFQTFKVGPVLGRTFAA